VPGFFVVARYLESRYVPSPIMQYPLLLAINLSLVTNNKINYGDVALGEGLLTLLGIGLWVIGIDVWRGQSRARKIGGVLLLLLAASYSVAWAGLNYWEYNQLRDYF
jgi:hypothetical protein